MRDTAALVFFAMIAPIRRAGQPAPGVQSRAPAGRCGDQPQPVVVIVSLANLTGNQHGAVAVGFGVNLGDGGRFVTEQHAGDF